MKESLCYSQDKTNAAVGKVNQSFVVLVVATNMAAGLVASIFLSKLTEERHSSSTCLIEPAENQDRSCFVRAGAGLVSSFALAEAVL